MQVSVLASYGALSECAAALVAEQVRNKPSSVLGLATGSTPEGLYASLAAMYDGGELNLADVTTFNLDEYEGLAAGHIQSYRAFMQRHLFGLVNVAPDRVHFPVGVMANESYDNAIRRSGGIDLQILGIGSNGHIGFNEPGSPFGSRTRAVDLTLRTVQDNARFFANASQVPRRAVTMGMATIMEARRILLLASGTQKAEAVAAALEGAVHEGLPASILQRHADVVVLVDTGAAAGLRNLSSTQLAVP